MTPGCRHQCRRSSTTRHGSEAGEWHSCRGSGVRYDVGNAASAIIRSVALVGGGRGIGIGANVVAAVAAVAALVSILFTNKVVIVRCLGQQEGQDDYHE